MGLASILRYWFEALAQLTVLGSVALSITPNLQTDRSKTLTRRAYAHILGIVFEILQLISLLSAYAATSIIVNSTTESFPLGPVTS